MSESLVIGNGERKKQNRLIKRMTDTHRRAFSYWVSLGKGRNYRAVAEKFDVSIDAVKTWAIAFKWKKRLAWMMQGKDDLFVELIGEIHDTRRKSILIAHILQKWQYELAELLDIPIRERRELRKEEEKIVNMLRYAISCFDPKSMKHLAQYVDMAVNFDVMKSEAPPEDHDEASVHFSGPVFMIKEATPSEKEPMEIKSGDSNAEIIVN